MDDGTPRHAPTPGERPRPGTLERPPGERYRAAAAPTSDAAPPSGRVERAVLAGAVVSAAGAIVVTVLGRLDLSLGLLAVGAALGWAVGVAVRWGAGPAPTARPGRDGRAVLAATLAAIAVVGGFLGSWLWATTEGGTLGPLDYAIARYGPLELVMLVLAVAVAALRAR